MTKQVQLRRGTSAEHSVFTGALAEVTVDTSKNVAIVHDGVTVGGWPLVGTAATQQIINKSGVGIGTSSLSKEFQVIGDADIQGNINSRSLTVAYQGPVTRSGIITGTPNTKIIGIATNNIRVGYAVSGTYIDPTTTVTSLGLGTIFISPATLDFTISATGNFLTNNGTVLVGIATLLITSPLLINVGDAVSGNTISNNTTITGLSTSSNGTVTISQASSGTLGITTRTGTSAGIGTTAITGVTTTSLQVGDHVDYVGGTVGITTIYSIGVNRIVTNTGLNTSGTTSFTFTRPVNVVFSASGFTTDFSFTDLISGQINVDVLNSNNAAAVALLANNAIIDNAGITTAGITSATITNANIINQITTNSRVSGTSTISTLYTNVGIGTTIFSTGLTGSNLYFNSGIGTNLTSTNTNITGIATISTLYANNGIFTTASINTITANNGIFTNVSISGISTANKIIITDESVSTSTIQNSYIQSGIITNLTSTNTNITGLGTIINLNSTNVNVSGISTISTLYANNGIFTTASINQLNVNNGIFTTASISTITANAGIFTNIGVSTIGISTAYIQSGLSTNFVTTNLNVTGIATISTLYVNNGILTTASINQLNVNNGIFTTASISTATINTGLLTTAYIQSGIVTNLMVSTETVDTLNINIGIGTTISSVGLAGSNLYFNSGIGTQLYVTGISSANSAVFVNSRVSGILTVGVSSIILSGNDATISGVTTLSANQLNISNRIVASDRLSFTYTGTLSVASTTVISGVNTFGVYSSYAVTGTNIPANAYVVSIGTSSITLNTAALNSGIQTTSFTFTDGTTGLSTIPNLIGKNIQYTGISTFAQILIASGNISSVTVSNLDMTNSGVASIATLKVQTGIITNLTGTNVKYTGISTLGNVVIGGGSTDLIVNGNARITGVLSVGTASITLDSNTSTISGLSSLRASSGFITNFYSNSVGINSTLNFVGVNTSTGLDQTVTFKLSQTGVATNYTLTLPATRGKDGQVLAIDGSGNLGFSTNPGGLYQDRLYVSSVNGSDLNDGKTKPVQSLKKAAQLASFQSFVLPGGRFLDAASLLTKNRTFIQEEVVGFLTATYPGITTDANYYRDVCYRDVGYIVDALAYDLTYNGNSKSVGAGLSYYSGVGTSYIAGEKIQTVDSFKHIVDISKYIINNVTIADPGGRYDDASGLLTKNRSYIQNEVVGFITATYPALLSDPNYSATKCARDVGYIVDALAYDIKYGGNMKSVGAGVSYWSGVGTSYLPGEQVQTVAAFNYVAGISSYIINNIQNPVSYQPAAGVSSVAQTYDLTIAYDTAANPTGYAVTGCANVRSNINTLVGIITTIVGQGVTYAPTITRPVGLYQTSVYQTYDTSIAYDASVNPVAYASTGCANVQSTISTLVGVITSIIGIGSTAAPTVVSPTSKSTPIAIFCEAGEYVEDNPIILYEDIAVIGDNLRNTIIRPKNAGKDLFRVRNGCYVTGFAMKDYVDAAGVPQYTFNYAVAFDDPYDPYTDRTGYAVKTTKPFISRSPYIQNCSILSFLGANGILVDGSKVLSPNKAIVAQESENPVAGDQPEFGKSMVAATFTMVSFGGIGWRVINDGYSQVVSCFQIFCRYGSLAQSGGYLSITNSATNFGLYALRSQGFSPNSFIFDRGRIATTGTSGGLQTLTVIGLGRINQDLYVLRFFDDSLTDKTSNFKPLTVSSEFNAATAVDVGSDIFTIPGHPFSSGDALIYQGDEQASPSRIIGGLTNGNQYYIVYISASQFKVAEDISLTKIVDITSTTTGINTFVKNTQDFFNKSVLSTHNSYQKVSLASTTSTLNFVSGRQVTQTVVGGTAVGFAYTYNSSTRELVVSVETSGGTRRNFQITDGTTNLNILDHSGTPVSVAVTNVAGITTYYTTNFKVDSTNSGTVITGISSLPENYRCHFHRPSIINANSHAWEYSGSGTDYNALPQNGGLSVDGTEQLGEFGGRVYSTGTNELGDFKVGNFITAYNRTGNIIFNNTVTIGQLDSLRLSLSGGTSITEFSTDNGLGDNEIGGAQDFRVPTQLATRSFLNNRLGAFIDKNLTTNSVPGAVVQLNASGQINADLIPPKVVNYYTSLTDGGRIYLANKIPAVNLITGDTVVEPSNSWVLISDVYSQYLILDDAGTYNWQNGDVVTSTLSGGNATATVVAPPNVVGYGTTGLVKGVALTLTNLVGGSGYLAAGIYTGVTLDNSSGVGTSITATVTVSAAGTVSNVAIYTGGRYYGSGDILTINDPTKIGGRSGGANFSVKVGTVETRLYLSLTNNTKFPGSIALTDYVSDRNAGTLSTHLNYSAISNLVPNDVALGGAVDFNYDRIVIPGHKFSDGDPVVYSAGGGNVIVPLIDSTTYYVKTVGISSVELYTTYSLSTKIDLLSNGTGVHSLTRVGVNTVTNQFAIVNHGYTQGDAVRVYGSVPKGLTATNFYFVGSNTVNTFTLHTSKADALLSANGLLYNPVDVSSGIVTGSITFYGSDSTITKYDSSTSTFDSASGSAYDIMQLVKQNVSYNATVNTSSTILNNWALLATTTIDANNIVSGIVPTSRLATGTANNQTFLRGDSSWSKVVSSVGIGTTQPIGVTYTSVDFAPGGIGINTYYGNVQLTLNRVQTSGDLYSTLGVARFKTSTFGIAADGSVYVKSLSQGGDIDAATLNGNAASYYLDITNTTGSIPITRGGTGLTGLPSNGAILIGNGSVYNLTTTPTFVGSVSFNSGASGAISVGANGDILLTSGGTWSGEKSYKLQAYNSNLYLQYTGSIYFRNQSATNIFYVDQSGNTTAAGIVSATQYTSTVTTGTAPFVVNSTTQVTYLNSNYLNGYATATANTVNSVVLRDSSGNFSAGTITATTFSGSVSGGSVSASTISATGKGSFGSSSLSNDFALSVSALGEAYNSSGAISSKYQYFNAGTIASLVAINNSVNSGCLIDFNAYNSAGGATGIYLGAVAGGTGNGPANFVVGRRTGTQTWAESLRVDTSGNLSVTGTVQGTQLISTIGTGTAPLTITSTTVVANLNVSYLQGYQTATANTANSIVLRDGSGNFSAGTITGTTHTSTVSTGTAPLTVSSTTTVPNLSAERISDVTGTGSALRITSPRGASYATSSSTVTGAIKIKLPTATFKSNTMMRMTVKIYEYNGSASGTSRTLEIGGYNYSDAAGNWINYFATQTTMGGGDINVRFGNDGTSQCIWIGETSTAWSYPQIFVTDFQAGYSNYTDALWGSGWTVSINGTLDTVTQGPIVAGKNLTSQNYNSYAPTLTGTGASGSWGISVTGSSASCTGSAVSLSNGSTFSLNTTSTYTQWQMTGSRNSYGGIYDSYSSVNGFMYDSAGNGGVYREANGRWYWYHLISNTCMGINTSTTSASYGLYVSGSIYSTGTVTAASDIRKKKDIETIIGALDKVNNLRGVTYKRSDLPKDDADYEKTQIGVIAQEVEKVVPEVVTYAKDVDEYSVSYGNFAGLFIEAIKEQNKIINDLKMEIEELKKKL